MTRLCCPGCGLQIFPELDGLGEIPLEVLVAEDDSIRLLQYQAAMDGVDYRHSVCIAAGFPVERGGEDGH